MLRFGLILLVLPALALMVVFYMDQAAVDACLDQGGSYNYDLAECDQNAQHPFKPLMARHPLLINGAMLLSVVGLLMCMKGLLWRPR
ncbi:MAG: hypothetical protein CSA61_00700 [Neptuniibacter caesariensis]|uniref:Uncharacterized protein n=1 Tax=Neptuniibacter caesariensis TaxID=207954 RepID=A0A2G6JBA5_NEPCE|nr:MAG: hypothetical protein CSA61_00700 [Neptuniibacter caesariensis]